MIALLFITDGRPYAVPTLLSAIQHLQLPHGSEIICVEDREHELGFNGAIREGWRRVLETDAEFVFHLEDDFVFTRPVPFALMLAALRDDPDLAQVALKRQAWNKREKAAGGLIEADPAGFTSEQSGYGFLTHHRKFFTTNPSLYPRWVVDRGWPEGPESEGRFGIELFKDDPEIRCAFWGKRFDAPRVHHIGDERAGVGY